MPYAIRNEHFQSRQHPFVNAHGGRFTVWHFSGFTVCLGDDGRFSERERQCDRRGGRAACRHPAPATDLERDGNVERQPDHNIDVYGQPGSHLYEHRQSGCNVQRIRNRFAGWDGDLICKSRRVGITRHAMPDTDLVADRSEPQGLHDPRYLRS